MHSAYMRGPKAMAVPANEGASVHLIQALAHYTRAMERSENSLSFRASSVDELHGALRLHDRQFLMRHG